MLVIGVTVNFKSFGCIQKEKKITSTYVASLHSVETLHDFFFVEHCAQQVHFSFVLNFFFLLQIELCVCVGHFLMPSLLRGQIVLF